MRLELDVQYAVDATAGLPGVEALEKWVAAALAGRREAAQLVVRIVDESEGGELNRCYRGRQGPTNVLSFGFEHPELLDPPLLGDVVICAPLVAREAREQAKSAEAHWAHLVVHGTLHLLGHDHEDPVEAERMEGIEREVLAGLGYPDPYAAESTAAGDGERMGARAEA